MYTPPKIIAVDYGAPANPMQSRALSGITDLIFHHTAGSLEQTALDIDREHRAEHWAGIGYNYVIDSKGQIYAGRPAMYVPSAAYGRNPQSINVVLIGQFQEKDLLPTDPPYTGPPTAAQIQAAKDIASWLHRMFPSIERTIGHRDVARLFYNNDSDYTTACPGDHFYQHLGEIKSFVISTMKAT